MTRIIREGVTSTWSTASLRGSSERCGNVALLVRASFKPVLCYVYQIAKLSDAGTWNGQEVSLKKTRLIHVQAGFQVNVLMPSSL